MNWHDFGTGFLAGWMLASFYCMWRISAHRKRQAAQPISEVKP